MSLLQSHFKKIFNETELDLNAFQTEIVKDINLYEKSIDLNSELLKDFTDIEIEFALKESVVNFFPFICIHG